MRNKPMDILCVTGTRADYGIYRPLLAALNEDGFFRLRLVVTGMHLLDQYGGTVSEIRKDRFTIAAAPSILTRGDGTYAMSQSVGLAVLYLADIFNSERPWMVLLLGDRGEMLAAATAAHYQNIVIAHLHGGEYSGSADDAVRHAVSRFSHLHFASTLRSAVNLVNMGEEKWRVITAGSLRKHDIEAVLKLPAEIIKSWSNKYSLDEAASTIMVAMHPDSKEALPLKEQAGVVTKALEQLDGERIIIIGPNSDAGGDLFREKLKQFASTRGNCTYLSSVPPDEYLFLLSRVKLLLGNSSSGIIEAPFFHLPFINVGNRQDGRETGSNVYTVPYDPCRIGSTARNLLGAKKKKVLRNPYDVTASPAQFIVNKLKNLPGKAELLRKQPFRGKTALLR